MTDERAPTGGLPTIEVVRDSTFVRFVADEAVLTNLGRDLEVAFLQYGPILLSQTDLGDSEVTDSRNVVTEVARMRMGQGDFLKMAMSFLKAGIDDGRLKGTAIRDSIVEWTAAADAAAVDAANSSQ